jgi:HEAT repeat protein
MPSRLSSLLVRDGLVGVKRMEKAFQRQVIYGGTLDTILLEMNLVPEERLTQYLALASGLPPAARDEGRVVPAEVAEVIAYDVAQRHRAVPVAIEGEAIRILVCAPIDIGELEDLADLLDRPLQPLITPEFRWNLVYAGAYGLDPPARYTTLARALDVDPMTPPVGRARSVIVAEEQPPNDEVPVPQEAGVPEMIGQDAGATQPMAVTDDTIKTVVDVPIDEMVRSRRMTLLGVDPNRAVTEPTAPMVVTRTPTRPLPTSPARRPSDPKVQAPLPKVSSAPISTEGRDSPVPVVRAREMLATAEDRDTVFLTVLRAARSRARWAGLLTVQGGAAIGRVALAEPGLDAAGVQSVLIPLDAMSPFRAVVASQQPHIGPIETGESSIDEMLVRLGGTMPPSALLMPIVLRDRVVAVVAAHRVHSDIRLAEVTELLPIATAASDALGRLIVRHKAAGYRAPTEVPVVEIEADLVDTKRLSRGKEEPRDQEGWSAPSRPPTVPAFEQGIEMSMEAEPPRPIDEVLDAIEAVNETEAEDAIADAIERPQEAIAALARRFPGKLRVERFSVAGRPLRAAQYGGLLELVVRLGPPAAELLIEKMASPQRDTRFYATVCTAELRPRNAIYALAERVFDQDYGVRASAIEALAGYPLQELGNALNRARRAVHSSDPEVVAAATTAIVELGDTGAIADLIGVIERADRAGEHARRALVSLTAQDFGPNEKKWRKWFDAARNRHRIEWLIEGLSHKEDAIRERAINDLRRLTGEYFGYHHDLAKKERDLAAHRWVMWWRDVGRRRFVTHEDERHRPTALLPLRRDH